MADKLLPCTCGGNGVTIDAEPPKEERESWEKHGLNAPRHYAVCCGKCGKQTKPYKLRTPAWKEWNRLSIRAWTLHRGSWRVSRCAGLGNITVLSGVWI